MGIVLLDLAAWRSLDLTSLVRDNFDVSHQLKIADQSIFNKYLSDYISELHIKYNWYTYFHYKFSFEDYLRKNNSTQFLSHSVFEEARMEPVIIHFIGTWFERPWYKRNSCAYNDVYRSYWSKIFQFSDLYPIPKLSYKSCYSYISYVIKKFLGDRLDYFFRYVLVQKLKVLL